MASLMRSLRVERKMSGKRTIFSQRGLNRNGNADQPRPASVGLPHTSADRTQVARYEVNSTHPSALDETSREGLLKPFRNHKLWVELDDLTL